MALPHPLPDELTALIARRFQVVAEPMRIRLLDRLRDGEASVNELVETTRASQQNVSKHLGVLLEAGIVGRRKQGNHAYYRIVDMEVFSLCETVCGSVQRQLAELSALLEGPGAMPESRGPARVPLPAGRGGTSPARPRGASTPAA